jgi:hypothetical protein
MALDGNAIGGLLLDVFAADMTGTAATCAACGAVRPVADAMVYLRGPGTVVRCRRCTSILMVITRVRGMNCVDLSGLAALHARSAGA